MSKKLIKTLASIACGLGIASSVPTVSSSCGSTVSDAHDVQVEYTGETNLQCVVGEIKTFDGNIIIKDNGVETNELKVVVLSDNISINENNQLEIKTAFSSGSDLQTLAILVKDPKTDKTLTCFSDIHLKVNAEVHNFKIEYTGSKNLSCNIGETKTFTGNVQFTDGAKDVSNYELVVISDNIGLNSSKQLKIVNPFTSSRNNETVAIMAKNKTTNEIVAYYSDIKITVPDVEHTYAISWTGGALSLKTKESKDFDGVLSIKVDNVDQTANYDFISNHEKIKIKDSTKLYTATQFSYPLMGEKVTITAKKKGSNNIVASYDIPLTVSTSDSYPITLDKNDFAYKTVEGRSASVGLTDSAKDKFQEWQVYGYDRFTLNFNDDVTTMVQTSYFGENEFVPDFATELVVPEQIKECNIYYHSIGWSLNRNIRKVSFQSKDTISFCGGGSGNYVYLFQYGSVVDTIEFACTNIEFLGGNFEEISYNLFTFQNIGQEGHTNKILFTNPNLDQSQKQVLFNKLVDNGLDATRWTFE